MKNITTITIKTKGKESQIRLPENYIEVFEKASASTEYHEKRLYDRFVEKFMGLKPYEKEMFEDFAVSGKYPTETLGDLFGIFKALPLYFIIHNVETYEDLGSLYATMSRLEYCGSEVPDIATKYTELGMAVCEMHEGFFCRGRFYGKIKT